MKVSWGSVSIEECKEWQTIILSVIGKGFCLNGMAMLTKSQARKLAAQLLKWAGKK